MACKSPSCCLGGPTCDNEPEKGSISLKFNSGDPALLYRGEGLEPLRTLGLHTSHELDTVRAERDNNAQDMQDMLDELAMLLGFVDLPSAVREILAERDALKAQVERLTAAEPATPLLPVDDEAEARYERLLAKKRAATAEPAPLVIKSGPLTDAEVAALRADDGRREVKYVPAPTYSADDLRKVAEAVEEARLCVLCGGPDLDLDAIIAKATR